MLTKRGVAMIRPAYKTENNDPVGHSCAPYARASSRPNLQRPTRPGATWWTHTRWRDRTRLQRVLALTAVIWHNWHAGQPALRSLIAYDR
jgi:hypothetical protein